MANGNLIKTPIKSRIKISKLITILCYDLAPTYKNRGEAHDFWEMVYIDRGEVIATAGEDTHRLTKGDIIFHRPNEFHSLSCVGENSASVFIITFETHSANMKFFVGRVEKLPRELGTLIKMLIEEAANTYNVSKYPLSLKENRPFGGQQLTQIYLEELLIRLVRREKVSPYFEKVFSSKEDAQNTLAGNIAEFLNSNIYGKVTIDMLSEHFHLGKSRLCDIFKSSYHDSIINYYISLKIHEAKRLIRENSLTFGEIAEKLNFESPAYFSRVFKKHTGMSPSEYRSSKMHVSTKYLKEEEKLI